MITMSSFLQFKISKIYFNKSKEMKIEDYIVSIGRMTFCFGERQYTIQRKCLSFISFHATMCTHTWVILEILSPKSVLLTQKNSKNIQESYKSICTSMIKYQKKTSLVKILYVISPESMKQNLVKPSPPISRLV